MSGLSVLVLVSTARNEGSGLPCRPAADARAVDLARQLKPERLCVLHAGDPADPALSHYLGMDVPVIAVIRTSPNEDPFPAIVEIARVLRPDLILTGCRAGAGHASGFLPYALAKALDLPIVASVDDVETNGDDHIAIRQASGPGQRRELRVELPAVLSMSAKGFVPDPPRYGAIRRGQIAIIGQANSVAPTHWRERQSRTRPKRMLLAGAEGVDIQASSSARAAAAEQVTPEAAARSIVDHLSMLGLHVPASGKKGKQT